MRRPSPTAVLALLALVVALGGTATAAKNTISGSDVRNRSLTGADFKPGSLSGRHFRNGTVGAADLRRNAVRGRHIRSGTVGNADLASNERVRTGPPGRIDVNKLSYVEGPITEVPDRTTRTASASCPAGQVATGGGFFTPANSPASVVPSVDRATYSVTLRNRSGVQIPITAFAICLAP